MPAGARAQTAQDIDKANQQSQSIILQEQQQRQQLLNRQRRLPPSRITYGPPIPPALTGKHTACFLIHHIMFKGVTALSPKALKHIKAPYLDTCMGLKQINGIIRATTKAYLRRGYVTTRVYVPQQNLSKGRLHLLVVEGRTESVAPAKVGNGVNVSTAFPDMNGKLLNLNDIEQGVAQLNRLSSNHIHINLEPGGKPGFTKILVQNKPTRRINGYLTVNNAGSTSTGKLQGGGLVNFDDFLHLNERIYLSYNQNLQNSSFPRSSDTLSGGFSVPFGYLTLTGNFSHFNYKSRVQGSVQSFDTNGLSNTAGLNLDWVFYRRAQHIWTLSTGYTFESTRNYLAGAALTSSSRNLAIVDLGISHSQNLAGGSLNGGLTLYMGLKGMLGGNNDQPGQLSTAPTNGFKKLGGNIGYDRPFVMYSQHFNVSTSVYGQFTNDVLPGSQQMQIGGRYTVRGFQDSNISGDRGAYMRNEISWIVPEKNPGRIARVFGTLTPYVGFDMGHVFHHETQPAASITGGAIGLRNYNGRINFDLSVAMPFGGSATIKPKKPIYYTQVMVPF